ncbi:hypothetical protein Trihar35433_9672 [Trichoderma harzianum]|nr:hypothetical protein Trihar35433_9672 [Trichoderma harzianum]
MSATNFAPVYLDNTEFFMNSSNIVNLSWPKVSEAFVKPLTSHVISFPGYDWTEPYPGKSIIDEGHTMGLMISDDFYMDETAANKSTTVLTGLTFNIPKSMKSNGKPLPMHPSWYICRHIFISTNAAVKKSGDKNTCDALPSDCKNDLAAALTNDWGYKNEDFMCSQRIADPIPQSCVGTFGFSRQDILTINSTTLADPVLGPLQANSNPQQYGWRIGTGYHRHLDPVARELAYNRTYLVATVWGFSRGTDPTTNRLPRVTWACMSGGDPWKDPVLHHYPDPPPHSHGNSTSTKPPSSATTSSGTVSSATTSSERTSSTTTSSQAASSTTTTSAGSISPKLDMQIIYVLIAMLMAGFVLGDYA